MRGKKRYTFAIVCILMFFLSFSFAMSASIASLTAVQTESYHIFYPADLGLSGRGTNRIFQITFDNVAAVPANLNHYLTLEVRRQKDNALVLSGNTDPKPYDTHFQNRSYYNFELESTFGGTFSISDESKSLEKKLLRSTAIPEGSYIIKVELYDEFGNPTPSVPPITITVDAPYFIPIRPVDTSVARSYLKFSWRSNLDNKEFRIYEDPRGKREIISGRLPRRNVGQSLDGSSFASDLTVGELYYWQVNGYMNTSHGREFKRGELNLFLFLEDGSTLRDFGLTEDQKQAILDELVIILKDLISRGASKSILGYDVQRIVLDNSLITWEEIMAILALIREGRVSVNAIYFR